jgi:tape measure domain-containing protein
MAVSNVELRVDARNAIAALQRVNSASAQAEAATQKLKSAFATAGQVQSVFGAKVANTESAIRKQIAALQDVQSRVQLGGAIYQKAAKQIEEYEARLRGASRATSDAATALTGLAAGAAAFNAQRIATAFITAANAADGAERRIKLVSQGFDDYRLVLQVAEGAAKRFGLSQIQASTAIADVYTRLRPVGFQLNEINAIYEGFNTAVKLSGVSAEAANAAFLQLSQGLGSGTLQGDELRSVLEQMPAIAQAIAKEMDVNVGSIKKFGSEGKITAEVIVRALDRVRTEGAGKLAQALDTPQQRIIDLQNAFEDLKVEVGGAVAPIVIASIKEITKALQEATKFTVDLKAGFMVMGDAFGGINLGIGSMNEGLLGTIMRLNEIGRNKGLIALIDIMTLGGASTLGGIARLGKKRRAGEGYAAPAGPEMPIRLSMQGRALGGGGGGGKGAANKAAREAERAAEAAAREQERVAQVIRERLAEGQILQLRSTIQDKIAAAEVAGDKQLAARLKGQEKELDIQYRYAQALAQEKDIRAQEAIIYEGNTALIANQREIQRELTELQNESARNQIVALENQINLQAELTESQKQQKAIADSLAITIGEGLASSFNALIQGSEDFGTSLRRIASGVLIDIANQLLRVFVIQKAINALSGLFGGGGAGGLSYSGVTGSALGTSMLSGNFTATPFSTIGLGFRANGGSVRAGSPYVVGERGPELFMPGRSGGIAPTGSFGGGVNVVVNVDAGGTSVEGNEPNANQMGRIIGAAVQAEIVKMQRPGGLLANTR